MTTIEAIYEQGVLRLNNPVALPDGTRVKVIIAEEQPVETNALTVETPAQIIAGIAALPMEPGINFHGRDHDEILYGWKER